MSAETGRKWWSVKLRIEDKELNALSALWAPDFAHGARHVHFGGSASEQESDPSTHHFRVAGGRLRRRGRASADRSAPHAKGRKASAWPRANHLACPYRRGQSQQS